MSLMCIVLATLVPVNAAPKVPVYSENSYKQAGAELCQADAKLG